MLDETSKLVDKVEVLESRDGFGPEKQVEKKRVGFGKGVLVLTFCLGILLGFGLSVLGWYKLCEKKAVVKSNLSENLLVNETLTELENEVTEKVVGEEEEKFEFDDFDVEFLEAQDWEKVSERSESLGSKALFVNGQPRDLKGDEWVWSRKYQSIDELRQFPAAEFDVFEWEGKNGWEQKYVGNGADVRPMMADGGFGGGVYGMVRGKDGKVQVLIETGAIEYSKSTGWGEGEYPAVVSKRVFLSEPVEIKKLLAE